MKTTTNQHGPSKLLKFCMAVLFVAFGFTAGAQCVAGFTFSVDPADDGDVAFTNTSSTGTGLNYNWSFGDGTGSSAVNPGTHNYASSGTYTACVTVYDSLGMFDSTLGCYNTYCSTFSVINTGGPAGGTCSASFAAFDSLGYGYFVNTSTGSGINCSWDFGDGTTTTTTGATDITHAYPGPGTYIICLTISNFLGTCSDTYCDSLTIYTGSSGSCAGIVDPTFTSGSTGSTAYFNNTPTAASGQVYYWDFGDGSTSSVMGSTNHTYASAGTYYVCLTVYNSADSCQYCSNVTVGSVLTCSAYFVIQQDSSNAFNYFIYNYSYSPTGSYTYLWDFGDGTSSTAPYPSHTYATTSPVLLCLTISDASGCTATYCDSIYPGSPLMPSGFSVNVVAPTGVEEQTVMSALENYPNPFAENTTISYSISRDAVVAVSIVDLLGNTVAELENGNKTAGTHSITWNAQGVAEGMYLLQLKVNHTVSTKKLVLSR